MISCIIRTLFKICMSLVQSFECASMPIVTLCVICSYILMWSFMSEHTNLGWWMTNELNPVAFISFRLEFHLIYSLELELKT